MQVNLKVQKNGLNTLAECLKQNSQKQPKKIYLFAGIVKESGFNIIEENFIDLKMSKTYLL